MFNYKKEMVRNIENEILIKKEKLKEAVALMQNAERVSFLSENGLAITLTKPQNSWVKAYKAESLGVKWWVKQNPKKIRRNAFSVESALNASVWVQII